MNPMYGAACQQSQSAVFVLPEKGVVGDVRITQLDWKRVPQAIEVPRLQKFCRHNCWYRIAFVCRHTNVAYSNLRFVFIL